MRQRTGKAMVPGAGLLAVALLAAWAGILSGAEAVSSEKAAAQAILAATGVQGGLVVHLGCGDGRLTAALHAGDAYLVHGLDADAANVEKAREHIRSLGLYGPVSVEQWTDAARLPYADNLVNLLVISDSGLQISEHKMPEAEVLRALAPLGVAYVRGKDGAWTKTVKPWPKDIDEWTHYLHDATGNAVANDGRVGPPRSMQWTAGPPWTRSHEHLPGVSAVVSSGGRLFYIIDEAPISSVAFEPDRYLVARDAFNGVTLWKRPVGAWEVHLRRWITRPPEMPRRLVAVNDTVYVTLAYGGPVTAIEAATGRTLRTYEGSQGAAEILYSDGLLILTACDLEADKTIEAAARRSSVPPPTGRRILVYRAGTGELLWKKSDGDTKELALGTIAARDGRVFFQNPWGVMALEAASGAERWRAARPIKPTAWDAISPTLVVYDDVLFCGSGSRLDGSPGELIAYSAGTGKQLWSCPFFEGVGSEGDALVADGLLWTGPIAKPREKGITQGLDPKTGEIRRERPPDTEFYPVNKGHHYCYRNKATDRYLVMGRSGVEFIELDSGRNISNDWIRSTCHIGPVPCNGFLYLLPHSCVCHVWVQLNGLWALAGGRARATQEGINRLEKGEAYGKVAAASRVSKDDWPAYRHDPSRSGYTESHVPAELKEKWQAAIGGRLSAVTVAEGKLFVASVDAHAVHALDAQTGKALWRFTAGGRIDSPPTVHDGMAVLGSADGYVYGLRAADGAVAWRFRAAPEDRRVGCREQIESAWPVHGSVLIVKDQVYFAAGRCSYLDGGIYLYRLDARTGTMLAETRLDSRDPKTGYPPPAKEPPGALADILSSDGDRVYMRQASLDPDTLAQQDHGSPHLFAGTGFLDDAWMHRAYWIYGTEVGSRFGGWVGPPRRSPAGHILVADGTRVYGFGRDEYNTSGSHIGLPSPQGAAYHLFACEKKPQMIEETRRIDRSKSSQSAGIACAWAGPYGVQARAMVLAGGLLFVAGPPDCPFDKKIAGDYGNPQYQAWLARQRAAVEGKEGGLLMAVSAADGVKMAEYKLNALPVFDGMAAAGGRLYLSTTDGNVVCMGDK